MSWSEFFLGEVSNVRRGTTITQLQTRPGNVPVVAGGMSPTYFHDTSNRAGNVITVSASGASAGYVNFWTNPIFASDCSTVTTNRDDMDIKFVYHFLRSQQHYINSKLRSGAAQPHVYAKDIAQLRLQVPPINVQCRIVAILDQVDALRAKHREALTQLDSLTQSIFMKMFGDPIANPMNWPVASLTDICHCYSGGTPSKACPEFWQGTVPWFSAKDLKADDLFDSQDHIAEAVPRTTNLKLLPANTIAICVRGMILAHTFQVSILRIPATINQDLKALLPRKPIETEYLAECLRAQSNFVLQQVSEAGHGTKRLDALGLREIRVLQPPESFQKEFSSQALAIRNLRKHHCTALAELDTLFASLQHRAFQGEL